MSIFKLFLTNDDEWTLWPATSKFLSRSVAITIILLLFSEWNTRTEIWDPDGLDRRWLKDHILPHVLSIGVMSYLPVAAHPFILIGVLALSNYFPILRSNAVHWPLLGRRAIAAMAILHLYLLKISTPAVLGVDFKPRSKAILRASMKCLRICQILVFTGVVGGLLVALNSTSGRCARFLDSGQVFAEDQLDQHWLRMPYNASGCSGFMYASWIYYLAVYFLNLLWSLMHLGSRSVAAPGYALLKAPSKYAMWSLTLTPIPRPCAWNGISMIFESVRVIHSALKGLNRTWYQPPQHFVPLMTAFLEVCTFLIFFFYKVTMGTSWSYPIILWTRLPQLIQGCFMLLSGLNQARLDRRPWVPITVPLQKVRVHFCINSIHTELPNQLPGCDCPKEDEQEQEQLPSPMRSSNDSTPTERRNPNRHSRSCSCSAVESVGEAISVGHKHVPGLWSSREVTVRLSPHRVVLDNPGSMRELYNLQDPSETIFPGSTKLVAKRYTARSQEFIMRQGGVGDEVYFRDVHMQFVARKWAQLYNKSNPPKEIDMIDAAVMEIKNPSTFKKEYWSLERFIGDKFEKYNSNHFTGNKLLFDSGTRNTPDAFSHFTHHHSNQKLMVADIQGVKDVYTDPQILTVKDDDRTFGVGNTELNGIKLWFASHKCKDICKNLKLEHPYPEELAEGLKHVKRMSHHEMFYKRCHSSLAGLHSACTSFGSSSRLASLIGLKAE